MAETKKRFISPFTCFAISFFVFIFFEDYNIIIFFDLIYKKKKKLIITNYN